MDEKNLVSIIPGIICSVFDAFLRWLKLKEEEQTKRERQKIIGWIIIALIIAITIVLIN